MFEPVFLGFVVFVGIALFVGGIVFLIHKKQVILPGLLIVAGVICACYGPIIFTKTLGWMDLTAKEYALCEWVRWSAFILWGVAGVLALIDAIFACLHGFKTGVGLPTTDANIQAEPVTATLGFLLAFVFFAAAAADANAQFGTNPDFVEINRLAQHNDGIRCQLHPFIFEMDASEMVAGEQDRWKDLVEKTASSLGIKGFEIFEVTSVRTISTDGQFITKYVIVFDGMREKPGARAVAPRTAAVATATTPAVKAFPAIAEGYEALEDRTITVFVAPKESDTINWTQGIIAHYAGTTVNANPTGGGLYSNQAFPNATSVVSGPVPDPLGR